MAPIQFQATKPSMSSQIVHVPSVPGEVFHVGVPEAIGSTSLPAWFPNLKPDWQQLDETQWESVGTWPDLLHYRVHVIPAEDYIDFEIELRNDTQEPWTQTLAFNCFKLGDSPTFKDHECARHWCRTNGEFKRLAEIPRVFGPRPTVQLYDVEGQPKAAEIPFVAAFNSTPANTPLEGWLAVKSRDGGRLAAVVSKPALFLFNNMEFSCIHAAPGFGALQPGETGHALTRIYFVEMSLEAWHARMRQEMGFSESAVRHGFGKDDYST